MSERVLRGSQRAFRPSAVFLGMVAVWITGGAMAWLDFGSPIVNVLLFVIAGWVVSLSLHEYAHAIVAYHSGDRAVAERGYLTLNPLKYAHPVLSIVLPVAFLLLGGIGLPGGAVWVDRHALRSKNAQSLVSLVGPASNFVLFFLLCIPFLLGVRFTEHLAFWAGLAFLAFLQLTAAILNLIPLPGLDGGNAIRPWLNHPWAGYYDQFAGVGMLLLFALLFLPVVNDAFFGFVDSIYQLGGAPSGLNNIGYFLFQFWKPVRLVQG